MKSPLAKARDKWFRSEDGKECREGTAAGQYLRNRLERAFLAGAKFSDKRIEELEAVYNHPNHDDSDQRYLHEIGCAIVELRRSGGEYAHGVAKQLDQFCKRARRALKK